MADNYSILGSDGTTVVVVASKQRTAGEKGNRVYPQVLDLDVSAANPVPVAPGTGAVFPVTGAFFQTTQPVSLAAGVVLAAGTNVVGKVGIDQTTPGTTNAVQLTGAVPLPTGAATEATVAALAAKTAVRGAVTNRSGAVTTGGTSQALAAANANRNYLLVVNPAAATESLWIDFGAAAVAASPSIELAAGQSFTFEGRFVSTDAVNVVAATTGHIFTAKEG